MLCKTVSYYTNKLLYSGSSSKYFAKSSSYELIQTNPIYTYTDDTWYSTQIRAVVTQMLSADGGREIWFGATPDGGTTVETAHYTDRNVTHTDTLNLTLWANQSLDLTQYFRHYWEGTVDTSLYLYGSGQIAKKQNIDITFTPLEVVHIGGQTWPVLFWLDSNGDFYVWDEVSSATTGSIAPGNFVGYVKIWKYKIPYYL